MYEFRYKDRVYKWNMQNKMYWKLMSRFVLVLYGNIELRL